MRKYERLLHLTFWVIGLFLIFSNRIEVASSGSPFSVFSLLTGTLVNAVIFYAIFLEQPIGLFKRNKKVVIFGLVGLMSTFEVGVDLLLLPEIGWSSIVVTVLLVNAVFALSAIFYRSFIQWRTKGMKEQHAEHQYRRQPQLIFLKSGMRLYRLILDELKFVQSDGNYAHFYTGNGRITTRMTMIEVEKRLPQERFCRVNKSSIIGLDHLEFVERDLVKVGEEEITIGMTYRRSFFSRMKNLGA